MKRPLVWLFALLFAAAVLPAGFAAERIRIEAPLVDPQTPAARKAVEELLEKTAAVSARLNGASIELAAAAGQGRSAYSLGVVAVLGKDNPAIVLTLKRLSDGAQSAPYSWLGAITPELPTLLARAVFLQWRSSQASPPRPRRSLPCWLASCPQP